MLVCEGEVDEVKECILLSGSGSVGGFGIETWSSIAVKVTMSAMACWIVLVATKAATPRVSQSQVSDVWGGDMVRSWCVTCCLERMLWCRCWWKKESQVKGGREAVRSRR